jgi:hypothetical protein
VTVLPNFLVIGANKAGTTSMHRYLDEHPQVFLSAVKEPGYFALDGVLPQESRPDSVFTEEMVATREAYEELFDAVDGERAVGEASTVYLPSRRAALRIREEIPDAKLIAILRDPSDRAQSAHAMYVGMGLEPLKSFEAAVDEELGGCSWRRYVKLGFYHEGLARYYELFGPDQVKVFLYEDLRDQPLRVLRDIFQWLDVDPSFTPDVSRRYNVSVLQRSTVLSKALEGDLRVKSALKTMLPEPARGWMKRRARSWNQTRPPRLSQEMRRRLIEVFEQDIRHVEGLIDRDLSGWLNV